MNKTTIFAVMGGVTLSLLSSCGSKKFAITTSGENLTALTKVTDNEEPCISPFGGDNGRDLFFAARENKEYYNIYKKENPFSSAMSQKTSGKNRNYSPAYCAATDKIAFRCQMEGASSSDIFIMGNNQGKALCLYFDFFDGFIQAYIFVFLTSMFMSETMD